jgi:hypothetical protein
VKLGEFKDLVVSECKRGDSILPIAPARIEMAVKWLERNCSLSYMNQLATLVLDPANDDPRLVELPFDIKSIPWIRYWQGDSEFVSLPRISPRDESGIISGLPTGYWISGSNLLVFNNVVEEKLYLEGMIVQYTDWPADDDTDHWLLRHAIDVLLYKTMENMAVYFRDGELLTIYKTQLAEALKTLMLEDEERRWDGADLQTSYSPYFPLPSAARDRVP